MAKQLAQLTCDLDKCRRLYLTMQSLTELSRWMEGTIAASALRSCATRDWNAPPL
jgi:hypothetical protein